MTADDTGIGEPRASVSTQPKTWRAKWFAIGGVWGIALGSCGIILVLALVCIGIWFSKSVGLVENQPTFTRLKE